MAREPCLLAAREAALLVGWEARLLVAREAPSRAAWEAWLDGQRGGAAGSLGGVATGGFGGANAGRSMEGEGDYGNGEWGACMLQPWRCSNCCKNIAAAHS